MKIHATRDWWKRKPILLRGQLVIRLFRGPVRLIEDVDGQPYMTSARTSNMGVVDRQRFLVLGAASVNEAKSLVMARGWLGTEVVDISVNCTFTTHRAFSFPAIDCFPEDRVQFREAFE